MITVWKQLGNDFSSELSYDDDRKRRYERMKQKILPIIMVAVLLLTACQPTPDRDIIVQKDTERLVETVELKNANEDVSIEPADMPDNPLVKMDESYTFDFVNDNGRLHIHADADVYVPETGKVPMARVKGEYFTDAFAKKLFDKIYQGETAYIRTNETRRLTKSELAEMIVYYQDLVDTGRTEDKLMDEEEAIAFIDEMKEEFKTAPDEPEEIKPVEADGTMLLRNVTDDSPYALFQHVQYYELWTTGKRGELNIRRHAEDDDSMSDYLSYDRISHDGQNSQERISYGETSESRYLMFPSVYDTYVTDPDDTRCSYGQTLSPHDAAELCIAFLSDLGVTDVTPVPTIDTYVVKDRDRETVENCYYFINFIRTLQGTPVAYLSPMDVDNIEIAENVEYEVPWEYEYLLFVVDQDGIYSLSWQNPVQITKVISDDAAEIPFEQAASIFEIMSRVIYEAQTENRVKPYYIDLEVTRVELSAIRIREKNAEGRTGLYVPAWIFYGKLTDNYDNPVTQEMIDRRRADTALLVVNAIDGSIIDLRKGY